MIIVSSSYRDFNKFRPVWQGWPCKLFFAAGFQRGLALFVLVQNKAHCASRCCPLKLCNVVLTLFLVAGLHLESSSALPVTFEKRANQIYLCSWCPTLKFTPCAHIRVLGTWDLSDWRCQDSNGKVMNSPPPATSPERLTQWLAAWCKRKATPMV